MWASLGAHTGSPALHTLASGAPLTLSIIPTSARAPSSVNDTGVPCIRAFRASNCSITASQMEWKPLGEERHGRAGAQGTPETHQKPPVGAMRETRTKRSGTTRCITSTLPSCPTTCCRSCSCKPVTRQLMVPAARVPLIMPLRLHRDYGTGRRCEVMWVHQ